MCLCVLVCECVCLSVYTINQKIIFQLTYCSIYIVVKHIVVYENSSDEFDIGHCPIKVKVMA